MIIRGAPPGCQNATMDYYNKACCMGEGIGTCACGPQHDDVNSSTCTGYIQDACVKYGGFENDWPKCRDWITANPYHVQAVNKLRDVCTGEKILKPGTVCNDFCQAATGAGLNNCKASVLSYCQNNMGNEECQRMARKMKAAGENVFDNAATKYCSFNPTSPFCTCLSSKMPQAHCLDVGCANSIVAYPSSTSPCPTLTYYDCKQALDVSSSDNINIDKSQFKQMCGNVINESDNTMLYIITLVIFVAIIGVFFYVRRSRARVGGFEPVTPIINVS